MSQSEMSRRKVLEMGTMLACAGIVPGISDDSKDEIDSGQEPYPFFNGEKWGYLDRHGRVAILAKFDAGYDFFEHRLDAYDEELKLYGYLRPDGSWAFHMPDGCVATRRFSEGRAWFRRGSCYGVVDQDGAILVEPQFPDAKDFSDGLAIVSEIEGFDCAKEFNLRKHREAMLRGGEKVKHGAIDRTGKVVIEPRSSHLASFHEGLSVEHGHDFTWRLLDHDGKVHADLTELANSVKSSGSFFGHVWDSHDDRIVIHLAGPGPSNPKSVVIDRNGAVIGEDTGIISDFSNGRARFRKAEKVGYYDTSLQTAVEAIFDEGGAFHDGICRVRRGKEWVFIDRTGDVVLKGQPEPWNDAEDFRGALARVHVGGEFFDNRQMAYWSYGKWNYVNRRGEYVADCRTDEPEKVGLRPYRCFGREHVVRH